MKIETKWFKICGCWQHSPKREVHSNTGYLKNQQTFEVNNLTWHLKELEKEQQSLIGIRK